MEAVGANPADAIDEDGNVLEVGKYYLVNNVCQVKILRLLSEYAEVELGKSKAVQPMLYSNAYGKLLEEDLG